jgi:hypothetical protein
MPDNSSYPVTLRRPAADPRPLAAVAAAALAALLLLALAMPPPRADLPARQRGISVGQTSVVAVAPAPATSESVLDQAAPALVVETSSIQAEAPAPSPPVQQKAQAASQSAPPPVQALQPAPLVEAAPRPAEVAPVAPPAAAPGSRWLADGFVFVTEGQDWDEDSFTNVEGALSRLPARIRGLIGNRALGNVNILINRSGSALSGKQPYGGPANFFSTNDGRNELVMFPDQSVPTILHELGHAYNLRRIAAGKYALVLLDPEMQSFMTATGWRVLSTAEQVQAARDQLQIQFAYSGTFTWPRLSNNDPLEDFANSFALYFYAPGDLQQKSPERFAWFEANVGR